MFAQKIILSRLRKFYLIIYLYIYEFYNRKRKKLNIALTKLKNLKFKNPDVKKSLESLSKQKNQLEIEKRDLEEKYKTLAVDYNDLSKKLDDFQNQEKIEKKNKSNSQKKLMN